MLERLGSTDWDLQDLIYVLEDDGNLFGSF